MVKSWGGRTFEGGVLAGLYGTIYGSTIPNKAQSASSISANSTQGECSTGHFLFLHQLLIQDRRNSLRSICKLRQGASHTVQGRGEREREIERERESDDFYHLKLHHSLFISLVQFSRTKST